MGEAIFGGIRGSGLIKSTVTTSNNGLHNGEYIKFATINTRAIGSRVVGGHLIFASIETGSVFGILAVSVIGGGAISTKSSLKWISIINPVFYDAIHMYVQSDNIDAVDLYIRQPDYNIDAGYDLFSDHYEITAIFGSSIASAVTLTQGSWVDTPIGSYMCKSYTPDVINLNGTNLRSTKDGSLIIGTYGEIRDEYIDKEGESSGGGIHDTFANICNAKRTVVEGAGNKAYGMQSEAELCYPYYGGCHAEGISNTTYGNAAHAGGIGNIAFSNQFVIGCFAKNTISPSSIWGVSPGFGVSNEDDFDLFIIGNGSGSGIPYSEFDYDDPYNDLATAKTRSNAFRVTYNGKVYGSQSYATGADYAEFFEWKDGNIDDEDRRGLFVTLEGEKIRIANSSDTYILGAVSAAPGVIGDARDDDWQGKYVQDVYGNKCTELVIVPEERSEDGDIITPGGIVRRPIINPEYNPDEVYVPRSERPEWDPVGLLGKLVVRDDGTCEVGKFCKPNDEGIATLSTTPGYYVMSRLDESHIRILVK